MASPQVVETSVAKNGLWFTKRVEFQLTNQFAGKNYAIYGEHIFRFKQQSHAGGVITLFIDYIVLQQDILFLRIPPHLFPEKTKLENDVDKKSEPSVSK